MCDCRICRAGVRTCIEATWVQHPRWMGVFTARYLGHLGWCPWPLYREVFAEMVRQGVLLACMGPGEPYPVYMLARLTMPAHPAARGPAARKGGNR